MHKPASVLGRNAPPPPFLAAKVPDALGALSSSSAHLECPMILALLLQDHLGAPQRHHLMDLLVTALLTGRNARLTVVTYAATQAMCAPGLRHMLTAGQELRLLRPRTHLRQRPHRPPGRRRNPLPHLLLLPSRRQRKAKSLWGITQAGCSTRTKTSTWTTHKRPC